MNILIKSPQWCLVTLFNMLLLTVSSQDNMSFSYDNAGNVIERKFSLTLQQKIRFDGAADTDSIIETLTRNLQIFPNPTNDVLNVDGKLPEGIDEITLIFYDPAGREILSEKYNGIPLVIPVRSLPPGLYYLNCGIGKDREAVYKIVISN